MGRFTLRLPQTLHQELENRAELEGVSLNQYIVYSLTRQVSSSYNVQVLPESAIEQQKDNFQRLLKTLGKPSSTDEVQTFLAQREDDHDNDELSAETVERLKEKLENGS